MNLMAKCVKITEHNMNIIQFVLNRRDKMNNSIFTTLGNDGKKYCFCISHENDGDYVEVHKMDKNRMSTFNSKTFVTRIPVKYILDLTWEGRDDKK